MDEPRPTSTDRAPTIALTALALAYPLVTARYFWEDWFRFLRWGGRMAVDSAGFLIRATDGQFTILSPWRLLDAAVTTALLFSAARRMKQGAPGARAFSLIVLLGVLLPQVLWYGELSVDWFQGRGFASLMLGGLAAVLLPALTLIRGGRALEGWGSLKQQGGRVLAAAVGLGWLGFGATAFLDRLHYFRHVDGAMTAALMAIPLAVLGMVGLYRQRAWGMLAAVSSAGALASFMMALPGGQYSAHSDLARGLASIVSSPASAVAAALFPTLLVLSLLRPFWLGFWRKAAGSEPLSAGAADHASSIGAADHASSIGSRAGLRAPEAPAHRAPLENERATFDEDAEALAAIESDAAGGRTKGVG